MAERESMNQPRAWDILRMIHRIILGTKASEEEGGLGMLDSYLKLTEECLDGVHEKLPSRKFNDKQCEYLALKLEVVVRIARLFSEESSASHRGSCSSADVDLRRISILKYLLALAKQIESFIQGCCKDAWIEAAMTLTNVSEYVSSLGFNLELLIVVITEERSGSGMKTLDEVRDINKIQVKIVRRKASADLETLCEKVTLELNSSRGQDRNLAGFLLQRLQRLQRLQPNSGSVSSQSSLATVNDDGGVMPGNLFKLVKPAERLGRGASATVYKAMWLGTAVAQKTFYGVEQDNREFMKESSILANLRHPNITSIFCSAMDRHGFSIIKELMDGDLFAMIQRRLDGSKGCPPFAIVEAIDIMLQVGEGVNYLHSRGIAHRNLKSFKILVKSVEGRKSETDYFQVKVADFGFSKFKERQFSNLTFDRGTNRWMPPENIKFHGSIARKKDVFKCDVYSFGMVCFEILTGEVPFSTIHKANEVKEKVMNGERPALPDHCPLQLKALIMKCWDQEPRKRPSFADICWELKYLKYLLMKGFSDPRLTTEEFLSQFNSLQVAPKLSVTFPESNNYLPNGRLLGRGSSADVYEVDWQGRKCAKKTFYGLDAPDFENEVAILEKLSHPNIMSLLYSGKDKRSSYIVTDLMDADLFVTMQKILNEGSGACPFTIRVAVDIMLQIARGVNYLHENQVVHRDIKAANILVKREGRTRSVIIENLLAKYLKHTKRPESDTECFLVRVADFGLARTKLKSRTTSQQDANAGSSRHMAPEIINLTPGQKLQRVPGQKNLPFKCDVYSFAMVCFEILTGNKPFPDEPDDKVVKTKVIQGARPKLPAHCPPELAALIVKCWDNTPSERPKFEKICVVLERIKASLETGNVGQDVQNLVNAASSSAGTGTESIHARDYFARDLKDKVPCTPCTWMVSTAIFLVLPILLALVMPDVATSSDARLVS